MVGYKELLHSLETDFQAHILYQHTEVDQILTGFSAITESKENSITWMKAQELDWLTIKASVVLANRRIILPENVNSTVVSLDNPRLVFAKLLNKFTVSKSEFKIHPTAIIGDNCKISKFVSIGAFTVIGNNVSIGKNSTIRNNVTISDNTKIGDRVLIKCGSIIGEEGFGFDYEDDGTPFRIPHIGSVIIGDDAEIGSLTTVCRGTLGDTIIGNHVKIDDHVHISHNVAIGEKTMIVACSEISGSVIIGRNVWVSPNSTITDNVEIGDDSFIGIGSVIRKNTKPKSKMFGNPARKIGET